MPHPLERKFTLNDLRAARGLGAKVPMLSCYDYSTARLMQRAGVSALLVGDSAANVILGHPSTLPVSLSFMIAITAAVRRGAPLALLVADMPFGSYHGSVDRGVRAVVRMAKESGCDCVKIEATAGQAGLINSLADAGIAVMAHIGLRPQSVGLLGGYKTQGRTAESATSIVELALQLERAGAAAILLEAVPPAVSTVVVRRTNIPIIGCGAGPDCHGHVVVTHDVVGLSDGKPPKFAPLIADLAGPSVDAFGEYARRVTAGQYPAPEHLYDMEPLELSKFRARFES